MDEEQSAYEQLSNRYRRFVDLYLEMGFNATAAARTMGYAHPNKQGPRLLVNDGIKAAISERLSELAMSAGEVMYRLTEHAAADIREVFTIVQEQHGPAEGEAEQRFARLDLPRLLESGKSHLVKSITWTQYGPKIVLHDAQAALKLIGEHHGLFGAKGTADDPIHHAVTIIDFSPQPPTESA